MQHNTAAFVQRATLAVALAMLCIALDPARPAERLAQADSRDAAVSQQAVLYEEDPDTARGESFYGLVAWRIALAPSGAAKQEPVVSAQISIPGHLGALLTLRRNTDQNLAASHVIEITFDMPLDASHSRISNVPGILMKVSERDAGVPLAGLAEKTKSASFLIGLSATNPQKRNNLQLLKDRDWLDILIVYDTGRRAILALQKGPSGSRAFTEAFSAWQE